MCKVLGIARSEYYYSKNKRKNSYEDFASTKSTRAYDKELGKLYHLHTLRMAMPTTVMGSARWWCCST